MTSPWKCLDELLNECVRDDPLEGLVYNMQRRRLAAHRLSRTYNSFSSWLHRKHFFLLLATDLNTPGTRILLQTLQRLQKHVTAQTTRQNGQQSVINRSKDTNLRHGMSSELDKPPLTMSINDLQKQMITKHEAFFREVASMRSGVAWTITVRAHVRTFFRLGTTQQSSPNESVSPSTPGLPIESINILNDKNLLANNSNNVLSMPPELGRPTDTMSLTQSERILLVQLDNSLRYLFASQISVSLRQIPALSIERMAMPESIKNVSHNLSHTGQLRIPDKKYKMLLQFLKVKEAVHSIKNESDLLQRLGMLDTSYQCYGLFHPTIPTAPLVFVEVKLTNSVASKVKDVLPMETSNQSISPVVSSSNQLHSIQKDVSQSTNHPVMSSQLRTTNISTDISTGISTSTHITKNCSLQAHSKHPRVVMFYSITNTQPGLQGLQLASHLLYLIVSRMHKEYPSVKEFATLSPMPMFAKWVFTKLKQRKLINLMLPGEIRYLANFEEATSTTDTSENRTLRLLWNCLTKAKPQTPKTKQIVQILLLRWAVRYLLFERRQNSRTINARALDPVGNFHAQNGATVERVNYGAWDAEQGEKQSFGIMVNYRYDISSVRAAARAYKRNSIVVAARVALLLQNTLTSPSQMGVIPLLQGLPSTLLGLGRNTNNPDKFDGRIYLYAQRFDRGEVMWQSTPNQPSTQGKIDDQHSYAAFFISGGNVELQCKWSIDIPATTLNLMPGDVFGDWSHLLEVLQTYHNDQEINCTADIDQSEISRALKIIKLASFKAIARSTVHVFALPLDRMWLKQALEAYSEASRIIQRNAQISMLDLVKRMSSSTAKL